MTSCCAGSASAAPINLSLMQLSTRFTAQAALAITICWVVALAVTGSTDALLFMAPALLIALPLLSGRYIGEELIAKLAAGQARKPPRTAVSPTPPRALTPPTWPPRGTGLVAFSLAKRPPPSRLLPQN